MRERPAESARRIGGLAKGDQVTVLGSSAGWSEVRTSAGTTGYVVSRALSDESGRPLAARPAQPRPAPAPAPRPAQVAEAPPPNDAVGVVQLTESNQLKRKAFGDQLQEAKVAANTSFDLDAKISGAPVPQAAG